MTRNVFFLLVAGAVMFLSCMFAHSHAETLTGNTLRFIGDFNFPPFAFKTDSGFRGFEIDLAEAIGRVMGVRVEWVPSAFDLKAYTAALEEGKADAILSSLTITPEREKEFAFTYPYFRTTLAIAALNKLKESVIVQLRKRKLEGSKVGVMEGTTGEAWARNNLGAALVPYHSAVDMARNLWEKNLNAILLDEEILNYIVARYPYDFAVISRDLDHEQYGIAVKKGNEKLLKDLNAALEKIDQDGIYDEIYNRWFGPKRSLPAH
ncbi:MAG: ABC transporter substrate-binding protein [PVC group bacterium]